MSRPTYPAAVHLVLVRDGELLVMRRFNTGYADGQYSLPAGHIDPGESASAAMVREAREEIGVGLDAASIRFALVQHKKDPIDGDERFDLFFTADGVGCEPRIMEADKCDRLTWVRLDRLPQNTVGYVRHAIEAIRSGARYAEFGW